MNMKNDNMSYTLQPLQIKAVWLDEPNLVFAENSLHTNPKVGIPLYGPKSLNTLRHKQEVHVGFIGTGESVANAQKFIALCTNGVAGDSDHIPFPGCTKDQGFRCDLRLDDQLVERVTRQETSQILNIRKGHQRFDAFIDLLKGKMQILTQKDHPLDYIVVVLPEDLYQECKTVDYVENGIKIHRDLRRTFKAVTMQFLKPTQILQENTTRLISSSRELDHPSAVAWNLFTGLYFKVDGLPWGPVGLPHASCFIGISFFRPLGEVSTLRTSVVQAFDENGDGLVLRGHSFHWDEDQKGKSPHLSQEQAQKLIDMVLQRYQLERRQLPQRVVVHKTSRFEPDERKGFEDALSKVNQYDLIAVTPTSNTRLIRAGQYPVLRGTSFQVGKCSYLYTTGYITELQKYPHGHVPSPLLIADHVGDTPVEELQKEILVLTKMNWNSANMHGLMPITLRFSRLVGDIMREFPYSSEREPEPKYKYYM